MIVSERPSQVLIEVCVASVDGAVEAERGGADRLELNLGLELGGLTPSTGMVEEVRQAVTIPVVAMVRPRGGGFRYSKSERKLMLREVDRLLNAGVDGIVVASLLPDGKPDLSFLLEMRRRSEEHEWVFHRAFDVIADPSDALEQLIDVGFQRVLTSGGRATAWEGRSQIAKLIQQARGRIEVLPGAGVTPDNVVSLVQATRCDQVHGSFSVEHHDPGGCVTGSVYPETSRHRVEETRAALDR